MPSAASTPKFSFKIHKEIERQRGKLLREFSEALLVASQNPGSYVELVSKLNVSGVGSIRRYARAFNGSLQEGAAKAQVFQVRTDDENLNTVYVRLVAP